VYHFLWKNFFTPQIIFGVELVIFLVLVLKIEKSRILETPTFPLSNASRVTLLFRQIRALSSEIS